MAVLQMEVVVRAVQVGRHYGDVVGPVLEVVALAHLQAGDLRYRIFLVGVFKRRCEQAVLPHRLRGVLRVDAGRAQEEELPHAVGVRLGDHVALDPHVHHDEVGAVEAVGHYATDEGGGEDDGVRALLVEETSYGVLVRKVQFLMGASHEVVVAAGLEVVPDGGADQPAVAGDIYLAVLV